MFDKYIKVHMDQYQIITDLKYHGYKEINERSEVRKLLNGIKTDYLDVVKTQIIVSEHLRSNFSVCISLYSDFLK